MEINILGTVYTLNEETEKTDKLLANKDGYCDTSIKKCVVDKMQNDAPDAKKDLVSYKKSVIRHELLHAFLFESGLDTQSWAVNEEMIDWIAHQFPKLHKAFEEADAL